MLDFSSIRCANSWHSCSLLKSGMLHETIITGKWDKLPAVDGYRSRQIVSGKIKRQNLGWTFDVCFYCFTKALELQIGFFFSLFKMLSLFKTVKSDLWLVQLLLQHFKAFHPPFCECERLIPFCYHSFGTCEVRSFQPVSVSHWTNVKSEQMHHCVCPERRRRYGKLLAFRASFQTESAGQDGVCTRVEVPCSVMPSSEVSSSEFFFFPP